jgi:hypothetical protein
MLHVLGALVALLLDVGDNLRLITFEGGCICKS